MILQNETIITCWAQVHAAVSLWFCDRVVFKPSGHRKSIFARKSLFWLNKKDTDEGDTSSAISERKKKKTMATVIMMTISSRAGISNNNQKQNLFQWATPYRLRITCVRGEVGALPVNSNTGPKWKGSVSAVQMLAYLNSTTNTAATTEPELFLL